MENAFENFVMLGAVSSFVALLVVLAIAITLFFHNRKIERTFMMIYKDSEERIGKANLMVSQCTESLKVQSQTAAQMSEMFNAITHEYTAQICRLQEQRDKLTEQNHDLIHTNAELTSILSFKKDQTINFNAKEK